MTDSPNDYYQFEEVNLPVIALLAAAKHEMEPAQTVLDIGCGRARLGMEMQRLGYRVTGIEASPVASAIARGRISEFIECDLLQFKEIEAALAGRTFDWIIASDVLEHLPYPLEALRFYQQFLAPKGQLVVSLPNVGLWDIRLRILFGQFNYADSGVLDRTHLRFFTIRTVREMLNDAGFQVISTSYDPGIVRAFLPIIKRILGGKGDDPRAIADSKAYRAYLRYILPVERIICNLLPGLFAFRIVMQARRA